jgi:hypothetical protein
MGVRRCGECVHVIAMVAAALPFLKIIVRR